MTEMSEVMTTARLDIKLTSKKSEFQERTSVFIMIGKQRSVKHNSDKPASGDAGEEANGKICTKDRFDQNGDIDQSHVYNETENFLDDDNGSRKFDDFVSANECKKRFSICDSLDRNSALGNQI